MEPQRVKGIKMLALGALAAGIFGVPIFRSGGRTNLTFYGWIKNHTIFGPPVEYVPEEDYANELEGTNPERCYQMPEVICTGASGEGTLPIVSNGIGTLKQYGDLLANVRRDGVFHPIRSLIQPDDPLVKEVADILIQTRDFIGAAQDFVHSYTKYQDEVGDYWAYPMETLAYEGAWKTLQLKGINEAPPSCDCDDMAILLCSILRNYEPPDQVFCAIGTWNTRGKDEGHMWVLKADQRGKPRIVESTEESARHPHGVYTVAAIFNDEYAFAVPGGLKEFGLIPVPLMREGVKV